MDWKKILAGIFSMNGLLLATTFLLTFTAFTIWIMPSDITLDNLNTRPQSTFYLCANGSTSLGYCTLFSINSTTSVMNATLNVSWFEGNGTVCKAELMDSSTNVLSDFSTNKTYQLPNAYPAGATFGLRFTRLTPQAGTCDVTIEPVAD